MIWFTLLAVTAAVVGAATEWKYVLAPLLGFAIIRWATASLRTMAAGAPGLQDAEVQPRALDPDEHVLYWCEECGTEVVLLVRGSGVSPRHCGTKMHERAELPS